MRKLLQNAKAHNHGNTSRIRLYVSGRFCWIIKVPHANRSVLGLFKEAIDETQQLTHAKPFWTSRWKAHKSTQEQRFQRHTVFNSILHPVGRNSSKQLQCNPDFRIFMSIESWSWKRRQVELLNRHIMQQCFLSRPRNATHLQNTCSENQCVFFLAIKIKKIN